MLSSAPGKWHAGPSEQLVRRRGAYLQCPLSGGVLKCQLLGVHIQCPAGSQIQAHPAAAGVLQCTFKGTGMLCQAAAVDRCGVMASATRLCQTAHKALRSLWRLLCHAGSSRPAGQLRLAGEAQLLHMHVHTRGECNTSENARRQLATQTCGLHSVQGPALPPQLPHLAPIGACRVRRRGQVSGHSGRA